MSELFGSAEKRALTSQMKRLPAIMLGLSAVSVLGAVGLATTTRAQTSPPPEDEAVLDRQLAMQQLSDDADKLGNVLAGIEAADQLGPSARAVANDAKEVRTSFQPNAPGGGAKPEVWSNWADFSSRLDQLVERTERMAMLAESGDINAVTQVAADAMPCQECHTIYRLKKADHEAPH